MIMNDLLNLDEVIGVLNNIPGAAIAVSIIKKARQILYRSSGYIPTTTRLHTITRC
jgi:hypothetical protein